MISEVCAGCGHTRGEHDCARGERLDACGAYYETNDGERLCLCDAFQSAKAKNPDDRVGSCKFCGIGSLSHLNHGVCDSCHTIDQFLEQFARSARGRARMLEVLHTIAEVEALRESEGQ